jgi:hypothetical protein
VVKSPALKDPITSPLTVSVEICGDHASNYTSSDSVTFTYLPVQKPSENKDSTISLDAYQQEALELTGILREIAGLSPESAYCFDLGIDALSKGTCKRKLYLTAACFCMLVSTMHILITSTDIFPQSFQSVVWCVECNI